MEREGVHGRRMEGRDATNWGVWIPQWSRRQMDRKARRGAWFGIFGPSRQFFFTLGTVHHSLLHFLGHH